MCMTMVFSTPWSAFVASDTRMTITSTSRTDPNDRKTFRIDAGGKVQRIGGWWVTGGGLDGAAVRDAVAALHEACADGATLSRATVEDVVRRTPAAAFAGLDVAAPDGLIGRLTLTDEQPEWLPHIPGAVRWLGSWPSGTNAHIPRQRAQLAAGVMKCKSCYDVVRLIGRAFAAAAKLTEHMSAHVEIGTGDAFLSAPAAWLATATDREIYEARQAPPEPAPFGFFGAWSALQGAMRINATADASTRVVEGQPSVIFRVFADGSVPGPDADVTLENMDGSFTGRHGTIKTGRYLWVDEGGHGEAHVLVRAINDLGDLGPMLASSAEFSTAAPRLLSALVTAQSVHVSGNEGTASISAMRLGGGWNRHVDGRFASFNLAAADGNSNAGIGASEVWSVLITAYGRPKADVNGGTRQDSLLVTVYGASAGPGGSEPSWLTAEAIAPALGMSDVTVKLEASAAPSGYTARVWRRTKAHPFDWTSWADVTGDLSPALTAPPTTSTDYSDSDGLFPRSNGSELFEVQYEAQILDGSSDVRESTTFGTSYYTGEGPLDP